MAENANEEIKEVIEEKQPEVITEEMPEELSEELSEEETETAKPSRSGKPRWTDGYTDEELEMIGDLLKKVASNAKSFLPATDKKAKKEIKGKAVITDNSDSIVTTTDTLKEDMLELNRSAHSGKILEGRVIGCRKSGDSNISTNLAEVEYGNGTCTVLIPDYLLFNYDVSDVRDPAKQKRLESRVVHMIGTEIKFVVKHFDQAAKTAYADRLKALEQEAYQNYTRHLKSTDRPRVKVGDIVEARVTAVFKNRIVVCALGSETTIFQDYAKGITEVSWSNISDLNMLFKKNMLVKCKVMSIEKVSVQKYSEKYDMIVTELSVKRTTANPLIEYFDHYKPGQYKECVITNVSESAGGIYGIISDVGKVDVMIAYPSFGEMPKIGDRRTIKITEVTKTDKNGNTVDENGEPIRRIFAIFADV